MGSPALPLPPDIRSQAAAAPPPGGVMMAAGGTMPQAGDLMAMLKDQVGQLEQWANTTMQLLQQINPGAMALMVPIAQAGKALQEQIADMEARAGGGAMQQSPAGDIPPGMAA